jgi:hypothetical protein
VKVDFEEMRVDTCYHEAAHPSSPTMPGYPFGRST